MGQEAGNVVNTDLSLLEKYEYTVSDVQKEILEEELKEFYPIKEGDVNVVGVYVYDTGDKLEAKIYVRNGLSKKINFEKMIFKIINNKNEILAEQLFDLTDLGDIPPKSARPYKLYFDKKNVYVDKIDIDNWKIVFNDNIKALETVNVEYENLPKNMDNYYKQIFYNFLNNLPKLKSGDISFSKFNMGFKEPNFILITIIVRNGANKGIKFEKVPITIVDDNENIIASDIFNIDDLQVSALKAKICTFKLKANDKINLNIDLNKCKVYFK